MENVFPKQIKSSDRDENDCNQKEKVGDIICPELQEFITSQLNQMRFNHFLTDMILHCEEEEFDVHSSVMAASSGFFQELVNKTGNTSSVQLPNVKASAIASLLSYIYTGNLEPLHSVSDLRNILKAATWLQVTDFLVHVAALISQLITIENYLDIWEVADEFENNAVVVEIEVFVTKNYEQLCTQPLFLEFTPTRMQRICKNAEFRKISTHIVLKSIISWVDYDKPIRRNFISALLLCIHENYLDDVSDVVEQRSETPASTQQVNNSMTCNTSPPRTTLSPPQRDIAVKSEPSDVEAVPILETLDTISCTETDSSRAKVKARLTPHQNQVEPDLSTEEILIEAGSSPHARHRSPTWILNEELHPPNARHSSPTLILNEELHPPDARHSSPTLILNEELHPPSARHRSPTLILNEELQPWGSPTFPKQQYPQIAISEHLNKMPRPRDRTVDLQIPANDDYNILPQSPMSLLQFLNSNIKSQIVLDQILDSSTSSGDNAVIPQESLHHFDSDATIKISSPQLLLSSDSLALSLNLENFEKLSKEYDLLEYCRSSNSQASFSPKDRVPRLHLTAVSNDNCHLRRFASRCKIIVNHTRGDDSPRVCDSKSTTNTMPSTPESLSWPCVCPILQPSEVSTNEAVTSRSDKSSFSPKDSEAIMLFKKALTDKLNSIPERETNSLQSAISVPVPVYHPMFYLNRNALEKSAFKPVVKNNRVVKSTDEEVVTKDESESKTTRTAELKVSKKHHKTSVHQHNRKNDSKVTKEFEKASKGRQTASTLQTVDNLSEESFNSSRETLSGLYNFNQQLNLRYWSRNFDGSPLTEPVVVILGYQKHGSLLMLNFNLDSHAWRRSEEIETVFKKNNLELLRNGVSVVYKNQVYIIGGEDKHGTPKSTVLILHMREHFHPSPSSSLLVPRSGLGGTIFQDNIYVVGGITVGGKILNHAERFSFDNKQWKEIEPLPVYGWAMSLAELGKKLISVGGRRSGECMIGCYSYDPEANQWTQLLGMPKDFESPYALVTLYGNQVLAFRRSNLALQGSVAWLDPVHFAWNNLDISGTPAKRILTAVRHRHKVWILDQSGRLFVYDPLTHTWENAFGFQRSISMPLYAFIVYRALPNQTEKFLPD